LVFFFFSSRRRHTRFDCDWSSDVCSSDLAAIGPGLARAALAGKVNGKLVDTGYRLERDADVAIVTEKDPEANDLLRHSTAHLLRSEERRVGKECRTVSTK